MNFDKENFSKILIKIKDTYGSINQMAEKTGITAAYLSKLIRLMYDNAPSPEILKKIADNSNGVTSYVELMQVCGYSEKNLESIVYDIYTQLKKLSQKIYKENNEDLYEVESAIETYQDYSSNLIKSIEKRQCSSIFLTNYYNKDFFLEDYNLVSAFLFLYDSFLKSLESKHYITVINYQYIDWFNMNEIYENLKNLERLELLSYNSKNIKINIELTKDLLNYIKNFSTAINLAYLSDFDNNALIELFKKKVSNKDIKNENESNLDKNIKNKNNSKYYMCPVYGRIAAGQPNWAEECMEGKMPIDPELMNIINPEECYFLKVNGESMNKVIKNGAYALIRKTDWVENGEIAVVLVNGFDATLKKFTKQGDLVILEPMSDDPNYTTQVYNKDTEIKIIGKYIGKMEMN